MSGEYPDVLRYLLADQTVGHEELCRAKFARAVKAPRLVWERDEKEEGMIGYYMQSGDVRAAIWGVYPASTKPEDQRWAYAANIWYDDRSDLITPKMPTVPELLPKTRHEAHALLVAALRSWQQRTVTDAFEMTEGL